LKRRRFDFALPAPKYAKHLGTSDSRILGFLGFETKIRELNFSSPSREYAKHFGVGTLKDRRFRFAPMGRELRIH